MLIESNELKVELDRLKRGVTGGEEKGALETGFNLGVEGAIEMVRILEVCTSPKEVVNEH